MQLRIPQLRLMRLDVWVVFVITVYSNYHRKDAIQSQNIVVFAMPRWPNC
jgi:hypothetical protein